MLSRRVQGITKKWVSEKWQDYQQKAELTDRYGCDLGISRRETSPANPPSEWEAQTFIPCRDQTKSRDVALGRQMGWLTGT